MAMVTSGSASSSQSSDTTSTSTSDVSSGNPGYSDASAGPKPGNKTAKPHFVDKKKKPEATENKATKSDLGYVISDQGIRCGACRFYNDKLCSLVQGDINGQSGVCAFFSHPYVFNVKNDVSAPPFTKIEAGYIEVPGGTRCGTCDFYSDKECQIVEGEIDPAWGCCVAWKGDKGNPTDNTGVFMTVNPDKEPSEPHNIFAKDQIPTQNLNTRDSQGSNIFEARKFCRGCSAGYEDSPKVVTCSKCGSMEFTAIPMSKFTLSGN